MALAGACRVVAKGDAEKERQSDKDRVEKERQKDADKAEKERPK
jgi:hypothetical protein